MRGKDGAQPGWQGFIGLKLGLHLWSKQDGVRCTMIKSNVENGCCNLLSGEHDPPMAGCVDVGCDVCSKCMKGEQTQRDRHGRHSTAAVLVGDRGSAGRVLCAAG